MDYRERFAEENSKLQERMNIISERIVEIENTQNGNIYDEYFQSTAAYLNMLKRLFDKTSANELENMSLEELKNINTQLYEDIFPENYSTSYANPAYAADKFGVDYGRLLSFLLSEIRSVINSVFETDLIPLLIHCELFVEVFNCFEDEFVTPKQIEQILYWFISDYSDDMLEDRISQQLDVTRTFATDIIMNSDLTDIRYLYRFGQFITDNEIKTAELLNSMTQEQIDNLADVFTEGYRMGFINTNKDISIKSIVNVRYHLGFERIIRKAVKNFRNMGLEPAIYPASDSCVHNRIGYEGAAVNRQYIYDHKNDRALFLDKAYVERRLGALKCAYEKFKEQAAGFAGPAVMEVFGEEPFAPVAKEENYILTSSKQKLAVELAAASGQIVNEYIHGDERSFTIIAFPLPEIGEPFEEIFNEIVKINTLDYKKYEIIQQSIIDILDLGEYVHIEGMNGNKTDLNVSLHPLDNPDKQTIFENCVADVNIPVGEVFTSPQLKGTNGCLHVKKVFLNELEYKNLEVHFEDGMISDYNCTNFESEQDNRKYVKENVLFHHDTLPMGEFAIGTNTTAYVVTDKYKLAPKMPILIAEKMGPHFAVGDTCYSWQEDTPVYNPDGKEIIARDNEHTLIRKEDISKAYFNCHTDITIPYDELGSLSVIIKEDNIKKLSDAYKNVQDGPVKIDIIKNGRFVLKGTESLNDAFV